LQEHECQFWCPAPLREGEQHRQKLRSDKYQSPAARLLDEFYEPESSAEAEEDTDIEVGGDAGTGPDVSGAVRSRRKTRSVVAKQSATTTAATVSTVKAAEKKKKRKRKASPPPAVKVPAIPTPQSREIESEEEKEDEATEEPLVMEDRPTRRSEIPAAKRQQELVQKMMKDALRQGLEAQRTAAASQARMHVLNKPRFFRPKPRVPAVTR
jgi:hypothetical protein